MRVRWRYLTCFMMIIGQGIGANYAGANSNELVILTTFSREPLLPLINEFSAQHKNVDIQIVHRRTQSSIQLINKSYNKNIDLVLSSSPFLMQHLTDSSKLAHFDNQAQTPAWLAPYILPPNDQVVTIGYSGAGLIWNTDYLATHQLPAPSAFTDLADFRYFGHITMSTPSRSGTTQLMIESILAKYGWQQGWRILLNVGANLATISSRSFSVSDYVAKGQFGIGPTIDSYAMTLEKNLDFIRFKYDDAFTLMPTYIAQIQRAPQDQYTQAFIEFLLSKSVQANMDNSAFAKHAVNERSVFNERHTQLTMKVISERETWVNLLFELAITKRLPQLKDTWLAINHARTKFADKPAMLAKLNEIEAKVFSIPVSEVDLAILKQTFPRTTSGQNESQQAAQTMAITEASHHWKKALAQILLQAGDELKQLNQVATP
ncbi:ABC transporter substrate-binding protein [Motilimonas sp. E26]|uniref:ABC transporter substrate-binding protein n=1 Tax=Motilimonas sp. E26 TaxID=2865674 RepID=UPI001E2DFF8B|nr:ABC transporter substrate-binding protein [Motilimonas sp. E26]MCE0559332.1 ABC transporter substrate-binding protein [Motilimonas sp. E26]